MTGYGFGGPWTKYGTTFSDKAAGASTLTTLALLGVGSYLAWMMIRL